MDDKLGEREEGGPSSSQDTDSAFRKVAEWYGSGRTGPRRGSETSSRDRGRHACRSIARPSRGQLASRL